MPSFESSSHCIEQWFLKACHNVQSGLGTEVNDNISNDELSLLTYQKISQQFQ